MIRVVNRISSHRSIISSAFSVLRRSFSGPGDSGRPHLAGLAAQHGCSTVQTVKMRALSLDCAA
jgi:hypothetical protein